MDNKQQDDLVSRLRREWALESPNLDSSALEIVGRIIYLSNVWQEDANHVLAQYNLTYTEFDIIATLRRSGSPYELTPTRLRESVLLSSGAMTAALARVEKKGLIIRCTSISDGRVSTAQLTSKGKKFALKAARTRFDLADSTIQPLPAQDRSTLIKLLQCLTGDPK